MLEPRLTLFAGTLLLAACSSGAGVEYPTDTPTDTGFCTTALEAAERQLDGFRNAYPNPAEIPRSYEDNQVRMVAASDWTSGFPAGSFWQMYEFTGDTAWREAAEQWTAVLEDQKHNTGTHDLGFMMFNSFGNGLRLANLADYELVLIQSAESLLTRYNATVGATRSWDFGERSFPVIVDNMMNLELLYFASAASNDAKYAEAATSHASTTLDNHFRPDHSSYHVVDFDPATGAVVSKQTEQGIADESAWSRGQAWGLYGFTMVYRYTRDRQFLDQAQNIADFFLDHPNLPEDRVPYFDFDAPDYPGFEGTRDSSAAAIATSALLELSGQVEEPRASRYRSEALEMLRSLASSAYLAQVGGNGHFLLKHATGHKPAGSEVDVAINYADYYYLEALLRCTRLDD
jgi:unsaturated chondroitin disaccharide hydrolase